MTAIRNPLVLEVEFTTPTTPGTVDGAPPVYESLTMECSKVDVVDGTLTAEYQVVKGKTTFTCNRGWPLWRIRSWNAYARQLADDQS